MAPKPWHLLAGLAGVSFIYWAVYKMALPRGIRNNNPGNLRPLPGGVKWDGEIEPDTGINGPYSRYATPRAGWRAAHIDVYGDIVKDGLNTIDALIHEYAPKGDKNNEENYAEFVAGKLGISRTMQLNVHLHGPALLHAISIYENRRIDADTIWGKQARLDGLADALLHLRNKGVLA
jgi:hypothetical protein